MQKQLEEQPGVAAAQLCGFFKFICLVRETFFMLCLQDCSAVDEEKEKSRRKT